MSEHFPRQFYTLEEVTPFYKKEPPESKNKWSKWEKWKDLIGGEDGKTLFLDNYQQLDPLEIVLKTGDVIEIIEEIRGGIFKVKIPGFEADFYTPREFIDKNKIIVANDESEIPASRKIELPSEAKIIETLRSAAAQKIPYIWGGTVREGVKRLLEIFPPSGELDDATKAKWTAAGLDCSGLLYEATDGYTPRNTSGLVTFGEAVEVENLSAEQIQDKLEPLDIIVWPNGHVIIVLSKEECIESRLIHDIDDKGEVINLEPSFVKVRPTEEILRELIENPKEEKRRKPVNQWTGKGQFAVRRWYKKI